MCTAQINGVFSKAEINEYRRFTSMSTPLLADCVANEDEKAETNASSQPRAGRSDWRPAGVKREEEREMPALVGGGSQGSLAHAQTATMRFIMALRCRAHTIAT